MTDLRAGAVPPPLPHPRPAVEPALLVLLGLALLVGVASGPVAIPWRTVAAIVLERLGLPLAPTWTPVEASIVWDLRLPRTLLALVVGAGLAGAGGVFQGLLRNPLADPYIIGVSAGAAFGATVAIATGLTAGLVGLAATPLLAFAGAVGALGVVYALARRGGDAPVEDLLLAGIAVSAFLGAVVSWLQLSGGENLQRVIFWLMGGFSGRSWPHLTMAAPLVAVGLAVAWLYGRDLNVLLLGDETARSMGVEVAAARRLLIAAGGLMAASGVAAAGLIGFVGLIVPHVLRLLVGPDHRRLIPASALGGASLLAAADVAARTLLPSTELPVGILTAMLGAPFFLLVLVRERRRFWT
ncbi:MAG: iron chelate uptake ABC transporter family permease subunit [Armatimonadota bacterium]|nr:iron chelate uptake ABC transporter family permease subunit [Armatimonadota bacterium]MDR7550385.1 iron chelate uptake ABC transporter family permease subunit [Armatimonadota bacterium]